jgi:hypothetical protein
MDIDQKHGYEFPSVGLSGREYQANAHGKFLFGYTALVGALTIPLCYALGGHQHRPDPQSYPLYGECRR